MNIMIFVQARMGSTRLPGKVLSPLMGKPMLHYLIERLKQVRLADEGVILTTIQSIDDPIVALCKEEQIAYYRGPEEDVLARYYCAAIERHPDVIVRITADCPLLDPTLVDKVIGIYKHELPRWDYISTCYLKRTFPRGLDVEIFSFEALERAFNEATDPAEREHVTPFMYRHPELFRLRNVESPVDLSAYRLTVDTPEDFALIQNIYQRLYPDNPYFTLQDIIQLLRQNPELALINTHVEQKPV